MQYTLLLQGRLRIPHILKYSREMFLNKNIRTNHFFKKGEGKKSIPKITETEYKDKAIKVKLHTENGIELSCASIRQFHRESQGFISALQTSQSLQWSLTESPFSLKCWSGTRKLSTGKPVPSPNQGSFVFYCTTQGTPDCWYCAQKCINLTLERIFLIAAANESRFAASLHYTRILRLFIVALGISD